MRINYVGQKCACYSAGLKAIMSYAEMLDCLEFSLQFPAPPIFRMERVFRPVNVVFFRPPSAARRVELLLPPSNSPPSIFKIPEYPMLLGHWFITCFEFSRMFYIRWSWCYGIGRFVQELSSKSESHLTPSTKLPKSSCCFGNDVESLAQFPFFFLTPAPSVSLDHLALNSRPAVLIKTKTKWPSVCLNENYPGIQISFHNLKEFGYCMIEIVCFSEFFLDQAIHHFMGK